jgi:hypothetical protein
MGNHETHEAETLARSISLAAASLHGAGPSSRVRAAKLYFDQKKDMFLIIITDIINTLDGAAAAAKRAANENPTLKACKLEVELGLQLQYARVCRLHWVTFCEGARRLYGTDRSLQDIAAEVYRATR